MGLLNKSQGPNEYSIGEKISDCVGKVGECPVVTDPRDNKLYRNKVLFETQQEMETLLKDLFEQNYDFSKMTNVTIEKEENTEYEKPVPDVFETEVKPPQPVEDNESADNIIARALLEIIKNLEEIAILLKERK